MANMCLTVDRLQTLATSYCLSNMATDAALELVSPILSSSAEASISVDLTTGP